MLGLKRTREFLRRLAGPQRKMKLVLVCGAWGGGTSAVAGLLANLGARGFGPYHHTNEPRTPVSFEFMAFRETILQLACERTLALKPDGARRARAGLLRLHRRIERQKYGRHDPDGPIPILFKYPLSALVIPQICDVFDTRLVYVRRSLEEIERSRVRRNWPVQYGRQGAEVIYRAMDDFERRHSHPIFTVPYSDLLAAPAAYTRDLARFAGLQPTPALLELAIGFARAGDKPPPARDSDPVGGESLSRGDGDNA